MSKEAVQQEQDFKVAMQQLSAEAEKVMPMIAEKNPSQQAGEEAPQSSVLSEQLQALENSLLRRIESLATEMETSRTDALNEHFKRIDEQLASIRGAQISRQFLARIAAKAIHSRSRLSLRSFERTLRTDFGGR